MVVVVLLSTLTFQLAHSLEAEPLLACVTMGMLAVNRRWERGEGGDAGVRMGGLCHKVSTLTVWQRPCWLRGHLLAEGSITLRSPTIQAATLRLDVTEGATWRRCPGLRVGATTTSTRSCLHTPT